MDSLRNIEPLMKLPNPGDRESKNGKLAGFVFRITSRPALQETDRLLDLRVAFLDDRLCRLDETGFIDNLAKIHPVK